MATERFIRWQRYTIEQLTFALNLFVGLSGASLAFGISLLREEAFLLSGSFLLALSLWLCQFLLVVLLSSPVSSISGSRQKPSETMKIKMPRMRLVYTVIEQKY